MTKNEWLVQYHETLSEKELTLLGRCYDVLQENRLQGEMPWGDAPVISPWAGQDAGLWNWDSVFHAMTVARFDGELASPALIALGCFSEKTEFCPMLFIQRAE